MIDILIPTFNRSVDLERNLYDLVSQLEKDGLWDYIKIIVSDNASPDDTEIIVREAMKRPNSRIEYFRQERNIGLENNALEVLRKSDSEYVLYLGDDDYLPSGYLKYLVGVAKTERFGVVIPGYTHLFSNGKRRIGRSDFKRRSRSPGFAAEVDFSNYGHQLSGLFFKRCGVLESYESLDKLRNIYPFIYFVLYNLSRYPSEYNPEYQVLVSQSNSKDWRYDNSGLLREVYKNYRAHFPNSPLKRSLCLAIIVARQPWRLRVNRNPINSLKAIIELFSCSDIDSFFKVFLVFFFPPLYIYTNTAFALKLAKVKMLEDV